MRSRAWFWFFSPENHMSTDSRANLPNLMFGLVLIVVGGVLALDRMHVVDAIRVLRFWPIGLVLFGVSVVVQAFRGGSDGPAGAGDDRPFHAGHILGIVLIGLLVTQTLRGRETARETRRDTTASAAGETVSLVAVLGEDQRVSSATRFRGGEMTSVMGGCTLDLRPALLAPGEEATLDVFTLMGGLTLRVPEGWRVDVRALPILGGVRDQRAGFGGRRQLRDGEAEANDATAGQTRPAEGAAPRLVLRGFIMMGGLIIRS
jgi:hypothetical protein